MGKTPVKLQGEPGNPVLVLVAQQAASFFFFFSSQKQNPENKFFLPEANYRAKDDALLVTALEVSVNLKDKWQGRSA